MLGAALLFALGWNLAHAREIKALVLTQGATGTRAEILLDDPADFSTLTLTGPDRLVLDLPDTDSKALRLPDATGVVRAVRRGQPVAGMTRLVFDLSAPIVALQPRVEADPRGQRVVLEWPGDGVAGPSSPAPRPVADVGAEAGGSAASATATSRLIATLGQSTPPQPAPATRPDVSSPRPPAVTPAPTATANDPVAVATPPAGATKTVQQLMRGGMRPLVIAIDAGHGGQDPGARGAAGSREKDLTLSIARELARQVDATPGLKAFLTRDSDVFIPLDQRYKKARAAKADLFVSIHADAFTNPAASGSSVFVLSQRGASSQAARWLANQENAADLVGGVRLQDKDNTLASVLLDLSQSATMKASEDMATHVLSGLKRLGKTHKPQVERANFVVLRSPDVPSMLVETAFITNPDEERRLSDAVHQRALARAILDGVNTYFTRQPPPGTLYAARAEAAASPTAAIGVGGAR